MTIRTKFIQRTNFTQIINQTLDNTLKNPCDLNLFINKENTVSSEESDYIIELLPTIESDNRPGALFLKARLHHVGLGYPLDYTKAIDLYEQAIALNHSDAMHKRAYMHWHGQGGVVDKDAAVKLYKRAVDLNHYGSMNNLALIYRLDQYEKPNSFEACKIYKLVGDLLCRRNFILDATKWHYFCQTQLDMLDIIMHEVRDNPSLILDLFKKITRKYDVSSAAKFLLMIQENSLLEESEELYIFMEKEHPNKKTGCRQLRRTEKNRFFSMHTPPEEEKYTPYGVLKEKVT